MDLTVLLEPKLDLERLANTLDGLGHEARVHCVRGWGKARQAQIYDAAKGLRPLKLEHFVPPSVADMRSVIHVGRNTLPAFNDFEKRFCRPEGGEPESTLWGYNEGSTREFTGPGYFVVHPAEGVLGEIDIDYRSVPTKKCVGWPEIIPNKARLGRFVWVGMVDRMRGISNHVSIGRAIKGGKDMNAWFVLVRKDDS